MFDDWRPKPTEGEIRAHHAAHASVRGVSWWVSRYPDEPESEPFMAYSLGDGKVWLSGSGAMVSPSARWNPRDSRWMPVAWPLTTSEERPQ